MTKNEETATVTRSCLGFPAVVSHGGRSYRAVGAITYERRMVEVTFEDGSKRDMEVSFDDWMALASGKRVSTRISKHPTRDGEVLVVSVHPLDRDAD